VIGVEGDEGHVRFAEEACAANGFRPDQFKVWRGIAAANDGVALFPKQSVSGIEYGLEPIFNASEERRREAVKSGKFDELQMISLDRVIGKDQRLDLLHIDIQGGEADLIQSCRELLKRRVAYILIGTHSREIEGRIFGDLLGDGWRLEIERPAILALNPDRPSTLVDGVQGWRNMALLPDQ
jgi:FkbM family methyltransferase